MSDGNWTDVVTATGTAVAGIAAVCAAGTWLWGLANERIDNALSAVHDLHARINRVVALAVENDKHVWDAYTEAWDSWSRFNQAYVVARRYHSKRLRKTASKDFVDCLYKLKSIVKNILNGKDDAKEFKEGVDGLVEHTGNELKATAWRYRIRKWLGCPLRLD